MPFPSQPGAWWALGLGLGNRRRRLLVSCECERSWFKSQGPHFAISRDKSGQKHTPYLGVPWAVGSRRNHSSALSMPLRRCQCHHRFSALLDPSPSPGFAKAWNARVTLLFFVGRRSSDRSRYCTGASSLPARTPLSRCHQLEWRGTGTRRLNEGTG